MGAHLKLNKFDMGHDHRPSHPARVRGLKPLSKEAVGLNTVNSVSYDGIFCTCGSRGKLL
jgi:hypothetical protein